MTKSELEKFGGDEVETIPEGRNSVATLRTQLDARAPELAVLLPQGVPIERLLAIAAEAARQNPTLLQCNRRTFFSALGKAAKDGLMPDGREGVITPYRTKQKDGTFQLVAQWNPMAHGMRKRAAALDGILVQANVVHEKDGWSHEEGDHPRIEHKPCGAEKPGKILRAYAIFRKGDSILHREVMETWEIEQTRGQSKDPDSLMWKKFTGEGYKKTVVRRGFKSVPALSEALEEIVHREDESYDFGDEGKVVALPPLAEAPAIEHQPPEPPKAAGKGKGKGKAPAKPKAASEAPGGSSEAEPEPKAKAKAKKERVPPSVLAVRTKMFAAANAEALKSVWEREVAPFDWNNADRAALQKTFDERMGYKS